MNVDGSPAIRFVAPGTGRKAEGFTLAAPADRRRGAQLVARVGGGSAAIARTPDGSSWKHGNLEVQVGYKPGGDPGLSRLLDSAGRAFPIATLPAPARRIFWLDHGAVDSATRAALARAFDEAALYSEDTRTAMTPAPKKARPANSSRIRSTRHPRS